MLYVKTPEEVLALIESEFSPLEQAEFVALSEAVGRVLAEDIVAREYVPDFDRSTVDGFAVRASDTFGCSDAIPAILPLQATVLMGEGADYLLNEGECVAVPTGGAVPRGTDGVVMVEYTEDYGDGTIGVAKPAAPGMNLIFRGDDVYPGKVILHKGRSLSSADIGALAAIGRVQVPVVKKVTVGVISTGDELVPPEAQPGPGQVRDVNSPMLEAMLSTFGCHVVNYGIVVDDEALLSQKVNQAIAECDAVLLSGGSSVGVKDAACRIIESPRERLIAILTNCFVPCNGRFPTLILLSGFFFARGNPIAAGGFVFLLIVLAVGITLAVSFLLSKTLLRGVPSAFVLELPPYRRPKLGDVIVRSMLDRTIFVLARAVTVAIPAGAVIWLCQNIMVNGHTLLYGMAALLEPLGALMGLSGVILMAFLLGIPANEIVIPILLMVYSQSGTLVEAEGIAQAGAILAANGWTWVTAVCVILFSLNHFPCATTLLTIRKETGSLLWTGLSFLLPTVVGMLLCIAVHLLALLVGIFF